MDIAIQTWPISLLFPFLLLTFVDAPAGVDTTTGISSEFIDRYQPISSYSRVAMQLALPPSAHIRTHKRLVTNSIQG